MADPILRLLDQLAPLVRDAFLAAMADIRSEAQIALIIGHLERGDVEAAIAALNLRPEFLAPLDQALRDAYARGGAELLMALPRLADPFRGRGLSPASTPGTPGPNDGPPSNRRG